MDVPTALKEIKQMSLEDRIQLVQAIWDSITADQFTSELSAAEKHELDRRLADDEANPDEGIPWEIIKAERLETIAAIREGLADVAASRSRPAREALAEIAKKYNLPPAQPE